MHVQTNVPGAAVVTIKVAEGSSEVRAKKKKRESSRQGGFRQIARGRTKRVVIRPYKCKELTISRPTGGEDPSSFLDPSTLN